MELYFDLPLLFTGDVSMVLIVVYSSQPSDKDEVPIDVESKYYCHDLLKPSEVSALHVVFGLKGVLAKQIKSFKAYTLTLVEWYGNLLVDPYVIPRLDLQNSCKGVFNSW
jgi:hypothetical protein